MPPWQGKAAGKWQPSTDLRQQHPAQNNKRSKKFPPRGRKPEDKTEDIVENYTFPTAFAATWLWLTGPKVDFKNRALVFGPSQDKNGRLAQR
jgi:hypothetical protein